MVLCFSRGAKSSKMLKLCLIVLLSANLVAGAIRGYTSPCLSECGKHGWCDACPGSLKLCCQQGNTDNECNGLDGCVGYACCKLGDCGSACPQHGKCDACGEGRACCNIGSGEGGAFCRYGETGCSSYSCCGRDYCNMGDIDDDYELVKIDYDVDHSSVVDTPPVDAGVKTIDNLGSSGPQQTSFSVTTSWTETRSFSHTAGASVTVGTEFKVGVPLIAAGSVSVEVSASYEFSYGSERSETEERTATYNCNAQPHKYVTCTVTYHAFSATVPYVATWRRKRDHNCVRTSEGVFSEVAGFKTHLKVEEEDQRRRVVKRTIIPLD